MVSYIIGIAILLILLLLLFSKSKYKDKSEFSDYNSIRELAYSMRSPSKDGAGVNVNYLKRDIIKAYRVINQKRTSNQEIYAFEKWLFDNHYIVKRHLSNFKYRHLRRLPHVNGIPRVIELSRFIVRSYGKIEEENIKKAVGLFSAITPLTFFELKALKDALYFALLLEIGKLSEKCVHYYNMQCKAKQQKIIKDYARSDSYIHAYITNWGSINQKYVLKYGDIDFSTCRIGFMNSLIDNELHSKKYIEAMRNVNAFIGVNEIIEMSILDTIFAKDTYYKDMSSVAKYAYLDAVSGLAYKLQTAERTIANSAIYLSIHYKKDLGEFLFEDKYLKSYIKTGRTKKYKPTVKGQKTYCVIVLLASAVLSLLPLIYVFNPITLMTIPFIFIFSLKPMEFFLKKLWDRSKYKRPVLSMGYTEIPDNGRTLVVVSQFVDSVHTFEEALNKLKVTSNNCIDSNVEYVLLMDFPSSNTQWSEKDQDILNAIKVAEKDRENDRISLFVRGRIKKDTKYVAEERKRGAIMSFFKALQSEDYAEFVYFNKKLQGYKLAVLLDDDTTLMPETIDNAINSMLHPYNQKYDLMSFGCKINRYSLTTKYSKRFEDECGIDCYPSYSDFYSDRFGSALFCGKAIIRIDRFVSKLTDMFPDGRILSHDIIEGAILCSSTLKQCVYEDAPTSFYGDSVRSNRWARGDVLLLPYIGNIINNRKKERIVNPINPIYKLVIFINAMNVMRDFALLLTIFLAVLSGIYPLLWYTLGFLVLPYFYMLVMNLRRLVKGVRVKYVAKMVVRIVGKLVDNILLLPYYAFNGIVVYVTTTVKMLFGSQNLLEWKPFFLTQRGNTYYRYVKLFAASKTFITAVAILSLNQYFLYYAALYFIYALIIYNNKTIHKKNKNEYFENQELLEYASKTYDYFKMMHTSTPQGLVADNVQIYPQTTQTTMTSPTNIGFSLLAQVAAYSLKLEDLQTVEKTLNEILDIVAKLPKWKGHLYNWYNNKELTVLEPRIVSTVDSGNFFASLYIVKQFAKEQSLTNVYERCNELLKECDFAPLYDAKRKLLYIVYNESKNCYSGYYDVLASEARLAYYIAVANGVECTSYFVLSRECMSSYGNTLLSWSGTAFEYLMPRIFAVPPYGSLLYTSEKNASKIQSKKLFDGFFGVSESGCYTFNDAMKYNYRANGIEELALSGDVGKAVVSPYSSFLMLPYIRKKTLANLRKMLPEMYGQYGFYESYDAEEKKIVASYMSHHQGMILCAITNELSKNIIAEYFMQDPKINSAKMLFAEENILQIAKKSDSVSRRVIDSIDDETEIIHEHTLPPKVNILTNGEYTVVQDALGRGYSIFKDRLINKFNERIYEDCGQFTFVSEEGYSSVFTPTFYPYRTDDQLSVAFSSVQTEYTNHTRGIIEQIKVMPFSNGEIRKVTIKNSDKKKKLFKVGHLVDLALNTKDALESHTVFSDMFIKTEIKENYAMAYRKHLCGALGDYFTVNVSGLDNVHFNTNRVNVLGRQKDIKDINIFDTIKCAKEPIEGDVLYPCIAFAGEKELEPNEILEIYISINIYNNFEAACNGIAKHEESYNNRVFELLETVGTLPHSVKNLQITKGGEILRELASMLLYQGNNQKSLSYIYDNNVQKNNPINKEIQFTDRIILLRYNNEKDNAKLFATLSASRIIALAEIPHQILVLLPEDSLTEVESFVKENISKYKANARVIKSEKMRINIENCVYCEVDKFESMPYYELNIKKTTPIIYPQPTYLKTGEGGFCEDYSYTVSPIEGVTLLPYSNVIGLPNGGTVITENGGGFTFGKNSRESKLTAWREPIRDMPSEDILLSTAKGTVRINSAANGSICTHSKGKTAFKSVYDGIQVHTECYMIYEGAYKVYEVTLTNLTDRSKKTRLVMGLDLVLSWKRDNSLLVNKKTKTKMQVINVKNDKKVLIYSLRSGQFFQSYKELSNILEGNNITYYNYADYFGCVTSVSLDAKTSEKVYFAFGEEANCTINEDNIIKERAKSTRYFEDLSNIKITTDNKALDILFNEQLLYQVVSSRINARAGFYQCGGAYGFRDQLQDALCLIYNNPQRVKEHILYSAEHQYYEGDVQHWWHHPRLGVRTRITDDRLFLAYVTNEYIRITGDSSILSEKVNYLNSKPLDKNEMSRYEIPQVKKGAEPLSEHIKKAIFSTLNFGKHNLLLIGGGDWNDGLDKVGAEGRGESVWLSMFCYMVIKESLDYITGGDKLKLIRASELLEEGINNAFYGDRFIAHYTDNEDILGISDAPVCSLSLLPQAFSIISGAAEKSLATVALTTARQLVDYSNGLIKLLDPPFDPSHYHGYISMYPQGMRENGGQYTHGAMWYIKALFKIGQANYAYELLRMINPLEKCSDKEKTLQYKGEPYVLAADVYSHKNYKGRAGWTWYTGSASWMYKIILEDLLGIVILNGNINFAPNLPDTMTNVKVLYKHKNTNYHIEIAKSDKKGLYINDIRCGDNVLTLRANKGDVRVYFGY